MKPGFELWDIESANLVGTYDSEDAALADVYNMVLTYGPEAVTTLALGRIDSRGRAKSLAVADELRGRAEAWDQRRAGSRQVDSTQAWDYYPPDEADRIAALNDDGRAAFNLGNQLAAEPGREAEAENAYRLAAAAGVPYAHHNLGVLLANQTGREHEAEE